MIDEKLEHALDEVGRDMAFAYARSVGWHAFNSPPKWVWWQIIADLRQRKQ